MNKKLKRALAEHRAAQSAFAMASKLSEYRSDYPKEPIGGSNPYWRCVHCKLSDPHINGSLMAHASDCEYRIKTLESLMADFKPLPKP